MILPFTIQTVSPPRRALGCPSCLSMSSSSVVSRAARGRSELPPQDKLVKFGLPDTYRVKFCILCDGSSLEESMFIGHVDCRARNHMAAWGNGTSKSPTGTLCRPTSQRAMSDSKHHTSTMFLSCCEFCSCPFVLVNPRLCKYVFVHGGFSVEYSTVQVYANAIDKNPALNHEFMATCDKYKKMKLDNPTMVLRGKDDLVPPRILKLKQIQQDEMEGEREFFCRLDVYTRKFGAPPKDQVVSYLCLICVVVNVMYVLCPDHITLQSANSVVISLYT